MAEAVFSSPEGPPSKARLDFTEEEFSICIACSGQRSRIVFGLCFLAISIIAPLLIGKLPTAWRLPLADRIRALTKMEEHPVFSAPIFAVKAILSIVYYEEPSAAH